MPVYEYECTSCGHKFELRQGTASADESDLKCPKCSAKGVKRVFSPFSSPPSQGGACAPPPSTHRHSGHS